MKRILISLCFFHTCSFAQTVTEKIYADEQKKILGANNEAALHTVDSLILLYPGSEALYYTRGALMEKQGKASAALADYHKCLSLSPAFNFAHINLSLLLCSMKDTVGAIRECNEILKTDPLNAIAFYNRGCFEQMQHKLKPAMEDFRKALQLDPLYFGARANLAEALAEQKEFAAATIQMDSLVVLFPARAESYGHRGGFRQMQGDLTGAMTDYDLAVEQDPENPKGYYCRAKFRDDVMQDKQGSVEDCEMAIRLNPASSEYRYQLSRPKYDLRDFAGVIHDCREALRLDSTNVSAIVMLGNGEEYSGHIHEALAAYDKAIQLYPQKVEYYLQKSVTLHNQKEYAAELNVLDQALKHDPHHKKALEEKASTHFVLKEYKAAVKDLDEVLKWYPNNRGDLYFRGLVKDSLHDKNGACKDMVAAMSQGDAGAIEYARKYCPACIQTKTAKAYDLMERTVYFQKRNMNDSALVLYDKLIALWPDSSFVYAARGQTKRNQNNFDGAIADYRIGVKLDPKNGKLFTSIAVAYYHKDNIDSAMYYYNRAIEADPKEEMAYHNMALIQMENNQLDLAIVNFRKAIACKYDYAKAYLHAGECYLKMNDTKSACYFFEKAEKLGDGTASVRRIRYCGK